jgi:hypothetical protein
MDNLDFDYFMIRIGSLFRSTSIVQASGQTFLPKEQPNSACNFGVLGLVRVTSQKVVAGFC